MPSITSTQLNQQLHAPSFLTEEDTTTKNQILNRHRESNHSIRLCHIFLWGFTRKTCIFCIFFLVRYHRTHAAIYCICFCLYVVLFDGNYVHGFDKKKQASNQQQYFCLLQRMDGSYGGETEQMLISSRHHALVLSLYFQRFIQISKCIGRYGIWNLILSTHAEQNSVWFFFSIYISIVWPIPFRIHFICLIVFIYFFRPITTTLLPMKHDGGKEI